MKDSILNLAAHEVVEDPKLIRIATITSFIHSVLTFLYLSYIVSNFIASVGKTDNSFLQLLEEYIGLISLDSSSIVTLVIVAIILLIGYALLPPVGDAGIISYLDTKEKSVSKAIITGMGHFFQMFEFNAAVSLFNITTFLVLVSRMYMMDILNSAVGIIVVILWLALIFLIALFLPYSKQLITLQGLWFFEAMQKSASLSLHNMQLTLRYVMISFLMHIRIILNIIILIGIPAVLLYFWGILGIESNSWTKIVFLIVILGLLSFVSYLNAIIEAFFQTYRYKVYMIVTNPQHETLQAPAQVQMQATLFSHN
jgi:hypothetical protein